MLQTGVSRLVGELTFAGYTGQYIAEHVVARLPTDLKWAIAGRSSVKLEDLSESLRKLNPDRRQPGERAPSIQAWSSLSD